MNVNEAIDLASGVAEMALSIGPTIAKLIPTQRKCNVVLSNESSNYTLCNPRVYIKSGRYTSPLPPCIQTSSTGEAAFMKTWNKARGCNGIFTYELVDISTKNSSEKIAVLFQVPFNRKSKTNMYALGVFDTCKECNHDMYNEMSKNSSTTFVRGKAKGPSLIHKGQNITIMATMSNCCEPVIKVQVSDN